MKKRQSYFVNTLQKAILFSTGFLGLAVIGAEAAVPAEQQAPETPIFLGGLSIAGATAPAANTVAVYRVYDAEAVDRFLDAPSDGAGIDPLQTAATIPGVFRSIAIPMRKFPVSERWAPIYRAISDCLGNACGQDNKGFAKMVGAARQEGFLAKLDRVNRGVNGLIAYRRDKIVYGRLDHWAKPAEILKRGAGDCEDFAILKMAALLEAGIPARSMSLVVLQDSGKGVFHAVLSVATGSGTFILDNVRDGVVKDISLPSYVPLYSFSTDRAWIHGSKKGGAEVAETKNGLATIAPGEGSEDIAPVRSKRAGWLPVAGG